MRSVTFIQWIAACLLILAALPAGATTRTWPGSAPCATTLQACITGSTNGDTIEIASNGPIDEDINLDDRSLTVRAANGYRPRLAAGRPLQIITSSVLGNQTVNVSGISLMQGYVRVYYDGTGTGTYDLRDIEADRFILVAAGGTVNAMVYNNRIIGTSAGTDGGLMQLQNHGAVLNADVWFNQIRTISAGLVDGSGILVDQTYGASGTVRLHGNTVRGAFRDSAIQMTEGLPNFVASSFDARVYNNVTVCGGTTDLNGGNGIGFVVYDGSIGIQVVNNTVSNCYRGISASHWAGAGAGASGQIAGTVWNNLIVANYGLYLSQPLASTVTNNYNLINATHNTSGGFALGANTIFSAAKLVSSGIPRLAAASPAIGAAHLPTLGLGLIANGLPVLDADGLRRMKGAAVSDPDIGAYEYGDLGFMHTASATSSSYISTIFNPVTNGNTALDIFATPNYNAGGTGPDVTYNQPFGSWYSGSYWTVFGENVAVNVPANAHFNVFVPALGDGRFRHVTTAANSSTWSTTLDDGSLNNTPNSIVLVNQNFTAGPVHNAHPVGVFYYASGGSGKWFITNLDQLGSGGNMPLGAGFSVYAQAPSPNAFRVTQSSRALSLKLDHPLLNNTPCAQIAVTRMSGSNPATGHFDVYYYGGYWYIYSYGGSIEAGDQFNVVINPAQVALCSDVIFANGFQ
ncbi:MAG: hypothetical protein IPP82_13755 [Xanthomonadales bacterium]|nr:hypothetical protein [Xanthomonadales bacterium]